MKFTYFWNTKKKVLRNRNAMSTKEINNIDIISFEYEDFFIEHGETSAVEKSLELHATQIVHKIK